MKVAGIVDMVDSGVERLNSTTDIRAKAVVCGWGVPKPARMEPSIALC
jgi:hypothetical protein